MKKKKRKRNEANWIYKDEKNEEKNETEMI